MLVQLRKQDFFDRPLPLAQWMLSLSMDTVTEGSREAYIHTYIHTYIQTVFPDVPLVYSAREDVKELH